MHYLVIENVLPEELFAQVRQAISAGAFSDGKLSASGLANQAKQNLQLIPDENAPVLERITQALREQPLLQAFAIPKQISSPLINRYEAGMAYGMHSDSAYQGELRTDVAYTLFLDKPGNYDGGELQILSHGQTYQFKLPAGSLLLYPCGDLHQVLPVTRGVRHAAVGWIQSFIRDADQRELIAKLKAVPLYIGQEERYRELAIQTNECIQRLIRMWGD